MRLSMFAALVARVAVAGDAPSESWVGNYTGWGYEIADNSGGDLPLRLHMRPAGSGGSNVGVTIDSPAARAFELGTENVRIDGPRIDFGRVDSKGRAWHVALTRDGGDAVIRGTLSLT